MSFDEVRPAGAGSRDFASDEALLTKVLHDVVSASDGRQAVELLDRAVALGRATRGGQQDAADRLASLVASLDLKQIEVLVRSLTRWFQLVNLAEDNERVRRLRARDAREAPEPRRGSVRHAVAKLAARGTTAAELQALLDAAELRLVMTAHPTEARRHTTIGKLARVFAILHELDEASSADLDGARRRLLATVQELWGSDELRAISLTVLDEVRGGLVHFDTTLAETVPRVYRDLEQALAELYPGERFDVPPLLSFGSWIGGDRDGNPFVKCDPVGLLLDAVADRAAGVARAGHRAGASPTAPRPRVAARDDLGLAVLRHPARERGDGAHQGGLEDRQPLRAAMGRGGDPRTHLGPARHRARAGHE